LRLLSLLDNHQYLGEKSIVYFMGCEVAAREEGDYFLKKSHRKSFLVTKVWDSRKSAFL